MKFIRLQFRAPLQSWGEHSRWDSRDTAATPTKSGIIGMIGCCMGLPRSSEELRHLNNALHIAVRTDRPGRVMTDFHTVQAPKGQKMLNSQGKPRGETIITPKQYLQDASFTVWLWGEPVLFETVYQAFLHPHWAPYLGRKSCVPSVPLLPVIVEADSIEAAARQDASGSSLLEIDCLPGDTLREDERLILRPDNLIDAALNQYQERSIRASQIDSFSPLPESTGS